MAILVVPAYQGRDVHHGEDARLTGEAIPPSSTMPWQRTLLGTYVKHGRMHACSKETDSYHQAGFITKAGGRRLARRRSSAPHSLRGAGQDSPPQGDLAVMHHETLPIPPL